MIQNFSFYHFIINTCRNRHSNADKISMFFFNSHFVGNVVVAEI